MRKTSVLKLFDEAILPVVLVASSKILTIFLVSLVFNLPWSLTTQGNFSLYFINFKSSYDLILVSSVSDLIMILVCAIGFLWVLFRASYFQVDKIHPIVAAKLHKKSRDFLITSSDESYHQAAVWLSLSWVIFLLSLNNTLSGLSSQLTFGVAVVTTLGLTVALLENSKAKH